MSARTTAIWPAQPPSPIPHSTVPGPGRVPFPISNHHGRFRIRDVQCSRLSWSVTSSVAPYLSCDTHSVSRDPFDGKRRLAPKMLPHRTGRKKYPLSQARDFRPPAESRVKMAVWRRVHRGRWVYVNIDENAGTIGELSLTDLSLPYLSRYFMRSPLAALSLEGQAFASSLHRIVTLYRSPNRSSGNGNVQSSGTDVFHAPQPQIARLRSKGNK